MVSYQKISRCEDHSGKRARHEEEPRTCWVRVDNIPPVAKSKHFSMLFGSEDCKVASCRLKGGSAFVQFERPESAVKTVNRGAPDGVQ